MLFHNNLWYNGHSMKRTITMALKAQSSAKVTVRQVNAQLQKIGVDRNVRCRFEKEKVGDLTVTRRVSGKRA